MNHELDTSGTVGADKCQAQSEVQLNKRPKYHGWNPARMAANLTMDELMELRVDIETNPQNANPACATGKSIYRYKREAHRKLDAIAWAVTHKMREARHA